MKGKAFTPADFKLCGVVGNGELVSNTNWAIRIDGTALMASAHLMGLSSRSTPRTWEALLVGGDEVFERTPFSFLGGKVVVYKGPCGFTAIKQEYIKLAERWGFNVDKLWGLGAQAPLRNKPEISESEFVVMPHRLPGIEEEVEPLLNALMETFNGR